MDGHFIKENIETRYKHLKIFDIISHQGGENKTTIRYNFTPIK